jgi:hypothetical protein
MWLPNAFLHVPLISPASVAAISKGHRRKKFRVQTHSKISGTNFMEQSLQCEATQEISRLLYSRRVYYSVQLGHFLSQKNIVLNFLKIHFNIILPSTLFVSQMFSSLQFSYLDCICIFLSLPPVLHVPHIPSSLIIHPNNI